MVQGAHAGMPELEWPLCASPPLASQVMFEANFAQGLEGELTRHTGFLHDTSTPTSTSPPALAQASTYWAHDKAPKLSVQNTDRLLLRLTPQLFGPAVYWRITQMAAADLRHHSDADLADFLPGLRSGR